MSLALIVPVGLIFFNLIATLKGGALNLRAPLLFAIGALSAISLGLAAELQQSLVGAAWYLKNTTDSTAATHFALIGGAVFGGFAALHYWFPKITGRSMGEQLGRLSFWTLARRAACWPSCRWRWRVGKRTRWSTPTSSSTTPASTSTTCSPRSGCWSSSSASILVLINAVASIKGGARAGHDPWKGDTLEWFALSPPPVHNFDVQPDVRSDRPLRDIRAAIARRAHDVEERAAAQSQPVA